MQSRPRPTGLAGRPRPAGKPQTWAGSGRRLDRTAAPRGVERRARSTPNGRPAAPGERGWTRRARPCDPPAGGSGPSRRRRSRGPRSCAARSRSRPRRRSPRRSGSCKASACTSGAPVWAWASMPADRSTPTGSYRARLRSRHRSPVPQATSSTRAPAGNPRAWTVGPAPAAIESNGHDPVDQVIARGDGVEHGPHGADLGRTLRQGRARRRAHLLPGPSCLRLRAGLEVPVTRSNGTRPRRRTPVWCCPRPRRSRPG